MFATLKNKLSLIFTKSWCFLRPKNKLGLVSFVILSSLIIVFLIVSTKYVHADFIPSVDDIMNWFAGIFFAIAGFFIKLTFWVLKFVIEIAGYNGYIDSPAVTVGWVMIRDMTNMFFIVVLLIISFGTILGLEHYEYKKLLVKVLMAAVIVNFSRIICGVIIDIAQVVMLTFVNGIAATAAGNLTTMFNIQEIFKLGNGGTSVASTAGLTTASAVFVASIAALVFGTMMLITMATFLLLLMARMAMLWVLIVLSPFAFVLNVLPQTEKYASQWWGQFGGHVVGGPVIVFFLWLSFVTVGTGSAHDEIVKNNALKGENVITDDPTDPQQSTGITEVMSWAKMANFAIAIAMLLAGAKMATELGMAGGQMMGKAGEIGKKVAMYASGYQAARWAAGGAYGGVKKGVGKAGSAVGMYLAQPFIRTGKTVGGAVGTAWKNLNWLRNEGAKKLETDTKKIRDLKYKRKLGQISKEDYVTEMAKLEGKGEARSKAIKELERKKKSGEINEDSYKAGVKEVNKKYGGAVGNSLFGGGMVARGIKGMLAGLIETGGRKMDRAENWMESYELAKEREELDYSNSSFAGGQVKRVMGELKEESEETKKEKGERKRAEMRVGALRGEGKGIMATMLTGQAGNMLKAEMQNRDWKGRLEEETVEAERAVYHGEAGEKALRSEVRGKMAKKGHHNEEEEEMMKIEMEEIEADLEKLKEQLVTVGENDKGKMELKIGALEEQLKDKHEALAQLKIGGAKVGEQFNSQATLDMLAEIKTAINKGANSDEAKAVIAKVTGGNTQAGDTYRQMFGDKKVTDLLANKKNLRVLESIDRVLKSKDKDGKTLADASDQSEATTAVGNIMEKIVQEIEKGTAIMNGAWEKATHTMPSLFAARSEAMRDHTNAFYRGATRDVKDKAAQAEIWGPMGIDMQKGAAQQAVSEELYDKLFKYMKLDQAVAAAKGFEDYLARKEKKGEAITDKERLIGMAMVQRGAGEGQVDDLMTTLLRRMGENDPRAILNDFKERITSSVARLATEEMDNLVKGFGSTLSGLDHTVLEQIKGGNDTAAQDFVYKFSYAIKNNAREFNGKEAKQLVEIIKKMQDDQFKNLIDKIKKNRT